MLVFRRYVVLFVCYVSGSVCYAVLFVRYFSGPLGPSISADRQTAGQRLNWLSRLCDHTQFGPSGAES